MENEPFEDVFPIEYGDFPMSFVSFQGCNFQENSFLHLRKCVSIASLPEGTWMIIPFSKWLMTMVSKSPK